METPIELELVGKQNDMYALKYPGLQVPIHVNLELLEKFKNSPDYLVREPEKTKNYPKESWIEPKHSSGFRA